MTTGRQLADRVKDLDESRVTELYALLWNKAIQNNPLKEWTMKLNPTREDLQQLLRVLPPNDCQDVEDLYFG